MITVSCLTCGKAVSKCPSQAKKSSNHFCSRSCAATHRNKTVIRSLKHTCANCFTKVTKQRKYCLKCIKELGIPGPNNSTNSYKTLAEITMSGRYANVYRKVRAQAHVVAKREKMIRKCAVCSYNKYVELCHKKAISTFSKDTLVSEINSKDNLVFLCPNCHWEFDNGLINLIN